MKILESILFQTTRAATFCVGLVAVTSISVTILASNATIDFTTVSSTDSYIGTESRDDLATVIAGSSLISSESLSAATYFGGTGGADFGYYLDVKFDVPACETGPWSFRLGPDFGRGGAIFLDGAKKIDTTSLPPGDIWWALDWGSDKVLYVNNVALAPGHHRLEAIGFEDCCAGPMSLEFQIGGSGWQEASVANLTPPDQDNDGVADCDDACVHSILDAIVIIDGCDSHVANLLLAGGCTISDEIANCAAGSPNHGAFVSCVAHLTGDLKKTGVISGAQKGAIDRCAAKSSLGN
jgi:hypothetical protein